MRREEREKKGNEAGSVRLQGGKARKGEKEQRGKGEVRAERKAGRRLSLAFAPSSLRQPRSPSLLVYAPASGAASSSFFSFSATPVSFSNGLLGAACTTAIKQGRKRARRASQAVREVADEGGEARRGEARKGLLHEARRGRAHPAPRLSCPASPPRPPPPSPHCRNYAIAA